MKFTFISVVLLLSCQDLIAEECQICRYHEHGVQHAAVTGDDGPVRKYAPRRSVDVLHIKIDVTPNFDDRTVAGTTTITCQPISEPLKSVRLDAVRLSIHDVRCDAADVADFSATDEELSILLADEIQIGQKFTIQIDYSAQPTKGLYFRTAAMGYPAGDTHLWTQGEPHEARHWFPCFDYPNERSTTEVICRVPSRMTVLSNGRRMGDSISADGLKAVRWRMDKPHVSYLICLVAGHFEKLEKTQDGIPLAFYTQPSLAENAANSFRDTADIMAFFNNEIGVRYPWNKYYQVTIRDFVAGGMENTTLTTLTHRTIFDESTENIRSTRNLDAHEMAHQWFGDYVTCKDWSHLWLNEGFATYYAHLYEGHKFGRDALLYGLYRDAKRRVLTQGKDTKPIVYKEYKSAGNQFDYRAYPKGSWVLHMLRSQLGNELYRECVKQYLQQNALSSVVTEDLNEVFEEVSGRSFDPFFDQWVYHARHPDLKVTYKWIPADKLAHVTVRQTHDVNGDVLLFQFPTVLRFIIGEDKRTVDHDVQIEKPEHEFFVPLPAKPSIVRFDPEYTVLANVSFDKPEDMLLAQLGNSADMIGRLLAIQGLGRRKSKKALTALKKTLNEDPFYGVRIEASTTLQKVNTDDAFAALKDSLRQQDARVRQRVVSDIGKFVRDETASILADVIKNERNPAIRASAIMGFSRYADEDSRDTFVALLNEDSFRNEIADAAINAMRTRDDPWYAKKIANALKQRESAFSGRSMSAALTTFARLSRHKKNKANARALLAEYLNHPKESVRLAAIRAFGELGDLRAVAVLEPLADADLSDRIQAAAEGALRKIREAPPPVPGEVRDLRQRLDALEDDYEQLRKQLDAIEAKQKAKQAQE